MTKKRKQRDFGAPNHTASKRFKDSGGVVEYRNLSSNNGCLSRTLLPLYYAQVVSLRQFLLARLPASSSFRRRRLLSYGLDPKIISEESHFLDSTVVGVFGDCDVAIEEERERDFVVFNQTQQRSSDDSDTVSQSCRNAEVCDSLTRHGDWHCAVYIDEPCVQG